VFKFVYDREHAGRPWPNLAPDQDASQGYSKFGNTYPWIVPVRLLYHCQEHDYAYQIIYATDPIPAGSYYPVGLGWFSFDIDYFAMMSDTVMSLLKTRRMRVLFYYHEGDNPYLEKARLDQLCKFHNLPADCYRFVSGNSQASKIENFVYFVDHELWYWRNSVRWNGQEQPGCAYHEQPRNHRLTSLSRVHKWWRATIQSELHRRGWLDHSYWSYNTVDIDDQYLDNPIETYELDGLESYMKQFVANAPYFCDTLTVQDHNSHWKFVPEHFNDSYCNIVLETLYDAEQSGGAFISEKTFKPIRHAQPFVVFGTVGTLNTLRELGYRTFDHAIDNSYDLEPNNTKRFYKTLDAIEQILCQDLHKWYITCKEDIEHNQNLFTANKHARLSALQQILDKN
jgi:hypothetical protein